MENYIGGNTSSCIKPVMCKEIRRTLKKDIGGNTSPCIKPVMCKEIRHTWKMILAVIHRLVLNQLYTTKLDVHGKWYWR